ncbi:synaptobrevin-domain-containing protein [Zopfochytrium polystomum]|nr:synaptobrevin-domain-containing protein [Zopfochytrium polystomum]
MSSSQKVQQVQAQVDDVVGIMQHNIRGVMQRGENLETLNERTETLQNSSSQFHSTAKQVRKAMFWKDIKTRILLIAVIVIVVGILIGLIVWWTGVGSKKNGQADILVPKPSQS